MGQRHGLARGASARDDLDTFLPAIEKAGYSTRPSFPLESWTNSLAAAARYAQTGGAAWQIILTVANPRLAADIAPFARAFSARIAKQSQPPVVTESEWVYITGRRFRVIKIRRDMERRSVEIQLEELA